MNGQSAADPEVSPAEASHFRRITILVDSQTMELVTSKALAEQRSISYTIRLVLRVGFKALKRGTE